MSYILDALRKADAQRERDPARGIHAQPATRGGPEELPRAPGSRAVPYLLASAVLVALAAVGWTLWGRGSTGSVGANTASQPSAASMAPAAVTDPVPGAAPVALAATGRSAMPPVASLPAPTPAPITTAAPAPIPATVTAPAAASLRPADARTAASQVRSASTPIETAGTKAAPASASAAPRQATADTQRVPPQKELPADVQRDLPLLNVSGGVYSDSASQRMLIVNGQVLGEGAEAAPGVVVEAIRSKSAVLRFRGQRFSVPF